MRSGLLTQKMSKTPEEWATLFKNRQCTFLLGAGASAAAGIPTFQDVRLAKKDKKSPLSSKDTLDFDQTWGPFLKDRKSPYAQSCITAFYRTMGLLFTTSHTAQPTSFHRVLSRLDTLNLIQTNGILTTNVDGLEEKAGIDKKKVVYVHGSVHKVKCTHCRETRATTIEDAQKWLQESNWDGWDFAQHHECGGVPDPAKRVRPKGYWRPWVALYGNDDWAAEFPKPYGFGRKRTTVFTIVGSSLRSQTLKKLVGDFGAEIEDQGGEVVVINSSVVSLGTKKIQRPYTVQEESDAFANKILPLL